MSDDEKAAAGAIAVLLQSLPSEESRRLVLNTVAKCEMRG